MVRAEPTGTRFELRGQLGAGANGVVHRVLDRVRGREVALKTLTSTGGRELYRFKREFRALADLVHPSLVALHELYTTDGEWMFTMELVDGVTFHAWVRPITSSAPDLADEAMTSPALGTAPLSRAYGPLHLDRLRDALGQLADGLVALHGAGKLHRDVKPSNVLVEPSGRVVILDFGLIADTERRGSSDHTHDRGAVGTPAYMSPEQAADTPLSAASDWYAVGVMLFEALTGRRVFEGSTEVILLRKQEVDPPSPIQLSPEVPADLDALCTALLSRDPSRRPDGRAVLAALGRVASPSTERIVEQSAHSLFVGRGDELDQLRRAFTDARTRGVTAIVTGESGMGKTALVRAFLDELSVDGAVMIVEGRCYEREAVPFKALDGVVDGLTSALLAGPIDELPRLIPDDSAALARLFPVFRRVPGMSYVALPGGVADPLQLRRQALGALRDLLGRIARRRPLVISIDDLHWGDADSAAALAELIRGPDAPRMLVICTHRAVGVDAGELLAPILAIEPADVRRIEVGGLTERDARSLWTALRGASAADVAVRDAAGNPMLLGEIARSDRDGAPVRSVDDAVRARLALLAPDAQRLLRTIAIAARPLDPELVVRAAGLDDGRAAITALRLDGLARIRGGATPTIEPSHDRIREAVAASMTEADRRRAHADLAAALAASDRADPEVLVEHYLGAGDGATAGRYAEAAAPAAEERLALHRAAELYGVALLHGELDDVARGALTAKRAHTLAAAGRGLEAAVEFQAAAALVPVRRDRLALRRRSVEQLLRAGQQDRGTAAAAAVLRAVGVRMPLTYRRTLLALVIERIRLRLRGLAYRVRPEAEVAFEDLDRIDALWSVASGFTFLNPVLVRVLATRMLRAALGAGELRRITLASGLEIGYLAAGGHREYERVEQRYTVARKLADQIGHDDVRGFVEICGGVGAYLGGRYADAKRRLDAGERLLRDNPTEVRWQLDTCEVFQLSNLWYLGDIAELSRLHPVYLRAAVERGNVHLLRGLRGWRSNITWLVRGDAAGAREAAQLALAPRRPGEPFHLHHYYDLLATTVIDLYERNHADAWARVDAAWRQLERSHLLRIEAVDVESHGLRGITAMLTDRAPLALRCATHLERVDSPLSRVLAGQLRGAVAARAGDRTAAAHVLRGTIADAEAAGMSAHRTAAELRLAQVQGDRVGIVAALDWFRTVGVADPWAFAAILTPGIEA